MSSKKLPHSEYDLILASASPRRRQLLDQIGVRYKAVNPEIDESRQRGETRLDYVQRLALEKSLSGHNFPESNVPTLGADMGGHILNQTQHRDFYLLKHFDALARIKERNVLRRSDNYGAREGRTLRQRQLDITRAWRHINQ